MTADKAVKLAFLLTATDSMSKTLTAAGQNLTKFQKNLANAGAKYTRMGGYFMAMGNQIAGGMFNIVNDAALYGDKTYKTAQKVGMVAEEWQKLAHAGKMAGISYEQLESGMVIFNKNISDAAKGTGEAYMAYNNLGISLKDAGGNMRKTEDILKDVANAFAGVEDSATKTKLATVLAGRSGAQLIPMLNSGAKGLEEMAKKAERMGLVNAEIAEKSEKFRDAMENVTNATLGLKLSIAQALMPILERLADWLTGFISWVSGFVRQFPLVTKIISFAVTGFGALMFAAGACFLTFGAASFTILKTIAFFKKLQTAITGVKFVVHQFWRGIQYLNRVLKISQIITDASCRKLFLMKIYYTGLSIWAKIAAAAQWLWNGAMVVGKTVLTAFSSGAVATAVKTGVLAVSSGIATAAQWLFNAALLACPIVWIVLGIMAVIAIVILMVKYWSNIVAFFKRLWEWIKSFFAKWGVYILLLVLPFLAIPLLIWKHWDKIKAWFIQLWGSVKKIFVAVWEWLKNMFLNYTPYGLVIKHWSAITAWFGKLWNRVKAVFVDGWKQISTFIISLHERFVAFGQNIVQGLIDGITGMLGKLWDKIKDIGKGIGKFFTGILGIHSPSAVFAKFGLNITQGLIVGLDRGGGAVERATGGLAMQAIAGTGQSIETAAGRSAAGAAFNYAPVIHINGDVSESTKDDFSRLLREHYREIVDIMRRHEDNRARLAFN
jgi:hypothetical protein